MQQGSVVGCQRCGALFAASAGACPHCGARSELAPSALGQLHEAGVSVMRPRAPLKRARPWATIVAAGGSLLVVLIASMIWMGRRREPAGPPIAAPQAPELIASAEPARTLDADSALDRARAEALRWSADAILAGIEAGPFVGGELAPEGVLRAEFGKPAGAHVGPGAGLHKELLVVTVAQSGLTSTSKTAPGRVGLPEPNCIVQDVWRKLLPDAVDRSAPLHLRYERSPRDGRAVYRISKESSTAPLRVLDGNSCSILVR